jgi:hypothetical protein
VSRADWRARAGVNDPVTRYRVVLVLNQRVGEAVADSQPLKVEALAHAVGCGRGVVAAVRLGTGGEGRENNGRVEDCVSCALKNIAWLVGYPSPKY